MKFRFPLSIFLAVFFLFAYAPGLCRAKIIRPPVEQIYPEASKEALKALKDVKALPPVEKLAFVESIDAKAEGRVDLTLAYTYVASSTRNLIDWGRSPDQAYVREKAREKAREILESVISRWPDSTSIWLAHYRLARMYEYTGEKEKAAASYETAAARLEEYEDKYQVIRDSERGAVYSIRADYFFKKKQYEKALHYYRKALPHSGFGCCVPPERRIEYGIILCLKELGRTDEAIAEIEPLVFKKWYDDSPGRAGHLYVKLYRDKGKLDECYRRLAEGERTNASWIAKQYLKAILLKEGTHPKLGPRGNLKAIMKEEGIYPSVWKRLLPPLRKYFPALAILLSLVYAAIVLLHGRKVARVVPELGRGYRRFAVFFLLIFNLPWVAALVFVYFGALPDSLSAFEPGAWSFGFYVVHGLIVFVCIVGYAWVATRGGAEFVTVRPGILPKPLRSARFVKVAMLVVAIAAILSIVFLWYYPAIETMYLL